MGLSDEIRSIIAEFPAGATLHTMREVSKPTESKTFSLAEIMGEYRRALPRSNVTSEIVEELRREHELGSAVEEIVAALLGEQ